MGEDVPRGKYRERDAPLLSFFLLFFFHPHRHSSFCQGDDVNGVATWTLPFHTTSHDLNSSSTPVHLLSTPHPSLSTSHLLSCAIFKGIIYSFHDEPLDLLLYFVLIFAPPPFTLPFTLFVFISYMFTKGFVLLFTIIFPFFLV